MKKFPNGFETWMETFYEVTCYLHDTVSYSGTMANKTNESKGTGGLYELAEDLTDEFEKLYKDKEWNGEFLDTLNDFLRTHKH
jgi:hypothetical protein